MGLENVDIVSNAVKFGEQEFVNYWRKHDALHKSIIENAFIAGVEWGIELMVNMIKQQESHSAKPT